MNCQYCQAKFNEGGCGIIGYEIQPVQIKYKGEAGKGYSSKPVFPKMVVCPTCVPEVWDVINYTNDYKYPDEV